MGFPAEGIDLFYMGIYGGFGFDWSASCGAYLGLATGLPQAGNPPYTISDFAAFYPQFFGTSTPVAGTIANGSNVITGVSAGGVQQGQLVSGPFPNGTVVTGVASTSVTVSNPATANAVTFSVYMTPPVPLAVIQAFLNLAYASLMSSRWREMWPIAMAWYIAHFVTLYLQSAGNPGSTPGQIAVQGLEQGLTASKTVGPVSYTQENLVALQSWGAWTKTTYGTQLISQAQVVGAGAIYVR